ncbi:hypothetical protein BsWGS_09264 [Bradybaena similaris]
MSVASIPARLRMEARSTTSLHEDETAFARIVTNELLDIKSIKMWRGAVAEFLGTGLLAIFTIGMGLKKEGEPGPPLLQAALGCGFFIAAIVSSLSNVSGAHLNPAVSIAFLVTRQISFTRFVVYTVFQTTGAVAGAGLLKVILPTMYVGNLGLTAPGPGITQYEALGIEILITFFFLFVILSLVDPGRDDLAGSVPLMVGLTLFANVLFAANLSGASMNPARAFGPAMILGNYEHQWVYWAGPLAGAVIGSLTYDWFFSTSPVEMDSLKKLAGKEVPKKDAGMYGLKDKVHDHDGHDDHNEEEEDYARHLLNQKLRREHTNGLPGDRSKGRFQLGSTGYLGSTGQLSTAGHASHRADDASINMADLEHAPESKI